MSVRAHKSARAFNRARVQVATLMTHAFVKAERSL